jgi:tetratricopeptide (TPR) repeat protein
MIRRLGRLTLAAALVVALVPGGTRAQAPSPGRVLVIPFDNPTRDASIFWLGEASAVLLADELNRLGVPAITREERLAAFDYLQLPPNAVLSDATVIRIGQLVGASGVVIGSLDLEGESLVVRARSIALETGRISREIVDRGSMPKLFDTFEQIARGIAPVSSPERVQRQHPSLAAFENYVKGLLAETPSTAVNYLNLALEAPPIFERARLALWDVYTDQGEHAKALAAVVPVAPDSPWSRRAAFLAGLSYISLGKYNEAFDAFKSLADREPTAAALNNVGVVQLRRGAAAQSGQAPYYFTKAAEADQADGDYFFNLGYAYWVGRDPQAAINWLREAVRRNPADGDAHFVLGAALGVAGSATEAAREKELAKRLSSTYEQWDRRPPSEAVPPGLERVKDGVEVPRTPHVDLARGGTGQRDQQELARFYLDRGRRMFDQQNDREAIADLSRALYLSPYEAEAHLLIGRIHLRHARIRDAIDAFKISLWSSETAQAHLALGEAYLEAKELESARAEAERAAALDPTSSAAKELLERIGAR